MAHNPSMDVDAAVLIALSLLWAAYGALHSLLASMGFKRAVAARLEERKLLARFGPAYRDYMARVPGLVPRPWRILGRDEARELGGA